MQQLLEKKLKPAQQTLLDSLQDKVNLKVGFKDKVAEAQLLWKSKGGDKGKAAFKEIKKGLEAMCVSVKACNYCEGNEANDIEHIYPKSFFPEKAFVWNNYLLACKQCNTGYKLDKCFVLDDGGNVHTTIRGTEPIHKTVAIVNPRIEDPRAFFWLNTRVWRFEINDDLSSQDKNKAEKTLEILELNNRAYLINGRKETHGKLFDKMDRLKRIINALTIHDIEDALAPYHGENGMVDLTLPIDSIKKQVIASTQQHIKKQLYPSVWYAIKTISSKTDSKWKSIFDTIPEAVDW